MSSKYEEIYKAHRHALGEPTKTFVDFFTSLEKPEQTVLDIGAGQGRDALFIARLGHSVTAVDLSPSGMMQLQEDANQEELNIKTHIVDVCEFTPSAKFDIVLIDRTLHMLNAQDRTAVLSSLLPHTNSQAFLLIADERSNIPAFTQTLNASTDPWEIFLQKKGFLFAQKQI
ncbi:putative S-adenosyl-L-methionine-dependent methyltransferase TehB [Rhodobiaceae bacterium]|nr:putative S-adenosyl-L-methionine-dependent methyltransferase TehB [Rhodobiaceae bacterium]